MEGLAEGCPAGGWKIWCPPHPGPTCQGSLGSQVGRDRSYLGARVLSKVLPADVGHDPRGQRVTQHINHGAEAVPAEPRWAVSIGLLQGELGEGWAVGTGCQKETTASAFLVLSSPPPPWQC